MHNSRAMTLVELLVALGLLSVVALGASSWIATTAQAQRTVGERVRFETAAQAVLERIYEDAMSGDVQPDEERERVVIENESLVIQTRLVGGQTTRTYSYNERDETVTVQITSAQRTRMRSLLGDVASFECAIESSDHSDNGNDRVLTVTITSRSGRQLRREIRLP